MRMQASHIVEGTVVLIALFWIVTNAKGFSNVIKTGADVTVSSAKALWGGGANPMRG